MNKHKNMNLLKIWLTKPELESLIASLKGEIDESYCVVNICEIIQEAFNRGDLK